MEEEEQNTVLEQNTPEKRRLKVKPAKSNLLMPLLHRYDLEKIHQVIDKCLGARTFICKRLDCTQDQLEQAIYEHPEIKNWIAYARETLLDLAEATLLDNLTQTKDKALRQKAAEFVLKSMGHQRGYMANNIIQQNITLKSEQEKTAQINAIFNIEPDS